MKHIIRLFCGVMTLWAYTGVHAQTTESKLMSGNRDSTVYADPVFLPANSTKDIDFAVDAAGFKGVDGQTYTELYLLLRPSQFTLEAIDNKLYRGKFQIDGIVYGEDGMEAQRFAEQRVYETDQPVLIDRKGQERVMVELLPISLMPGTYRIEITLTDMLSKRVGKCVKPFIAHNLAGNEPVLSDLQLSTHVQIDTTGHRFTKNDILAVPNPMRIFEKWPEGMSLQAPRMMYFYFELYNLADEGGTYNLSYAIESLSSGVKWPLPGQKDIKNPGPIGVKVLSLDITSFPEDVYGIELTVQDNTTGKKAIRRSYFEVVQPPPPPKSVTTLTEEQAKRGYRMIKFIATKEELSLYEKLDLEGKTEFLINFWKERDPTPNTPENELLMVFNERFSYADGQLGGAESDRGKVFMTYGEPEEIQRNESQNNLKPYQVWYYVDGVKGDPSRMGTTDGRQFFVFGDIFGVGRYRLLHSSAVGEINNPNWLNELLINPGDIIDPSAASGVLTGSQAP